MPAAARVFVEGSGDYKDAQHTSWSPDPLKITSGSSNVFINGAPAARKDDPVETHTKGDDTHSTKKINEGSDNVFINNKKAARKGHALNCGGTVHKGSDNVFINGN